MKIRGCREPDPSPSPSPEGGGGGGGAPPWRLKGSKVGGGNAVEDEETSTCKCASRVKSEFTNL